MPEVIKTRAKYQTFAGRKAAKPHGVPPSQSGGCGIGLRHKRRKWKKHGHEPANASFSGRSY